MKIISVVGARPNFMKIAPFIRAIEKHNRISNQKVRHTLVHTGQHYDHQMSQTFFESLDIPTADIHLGVGSGTHAEQVGYTMIAFEKVVIEEKPDWVVVLGDINATLACTVTAKKLYVKCCHIEAGLRSGDWTMPEEINRIVTDRLSDLMLTPDRTSIENLKREGIPDRKISFVGNIMIDTLEAQREKAAKLSLQQVIDANKLAEVRSIPELVENNYVVMTLHRPSNVDDVDVFKPIIEFLSNEVAADMPLIWPIHPRALKQLEEFGLWDKVTSTPNLVLLRPVGYHEILRLNMSARLIISDSGGIQGESIALKVKCLILRNNTEWTVTLKENGGSSVLVGNDVKNIRKEYRIAVEDVFSGSVPDFWDGRTADRCLQSLITYH